MDTKQLAALMGVTESDVQGFVDCLRVWMDKGMGLEEAMEANRRTWIGLLEKVNDGVNRPTSIYRPATSALASHMSSEIWHLVNGKEVAA